LRQRLARYAEPLLREAAVRADIRVPAIFYLGYSYFLCELVRRHGKTLTKSRSCTKRSEAE
jgi:hypothetical protein